MLLSGLSFKDLYRLSHQGVQGLPRDVTVKTLNNFAHRYGTTPDILQMALPQLAGNTKGYMAQPEEITAVADRIEVDFYQSEFNEQIYDKESNQQRTVKLVSHGGAIAMYLAVDAYSDYAHSWAVKTLSDPVVQVKRTVDTYLQEIQKKPKLTAADQGILTQSKFRVMVPETSRYLEREHILQEVGEAYRHNNGLSRVERMARSLHESVRFAILYILNNPNLEHLLFTRKQILQLWVELENWALWCNRFKQCPHVEDIKRNMKYIGEKILIYDV